MVCSFQNAPYLAENNGIWRNNTVVTRIHLDNLQGENANGISQHHQDQGRNCTR
jgi:hypothetical protein